MTSEHDPEPSEQGRSEQDASEQDASPRVAGPAAPESARERADRQRRRARVFGEVLPEGTVDERGDAWGDREGSTDEWLRRQVPPHHG